MLFAGHETFHIRDGWLHKGLLAVKNDSKIFADPNATDVLGVGRNMVNAIRYWLVAAGMATETKEKDENNRPRPKVVLSKFGELVRKHDPYLEEDLSLWTIHYNLACNYTRATAWYWLFNKFPMKRFDGQTFINFLSRWVAQESTKDIALPSLQKDFNCVVRTYTTPVLKRQKVSPEDTFESPFASLQLMDFMENTGSYRMNVGVRAIPPSAMGYAVLRFLESQGEGVSEVSFQDLLSASGSPGRVFLLSSDGLLACIDRLQEVYGKRKFSYSRTAGMNILRASAGTSTDFLEAAYKEIG